MTSIIRVQLFIIFLLCSALVCAQDKEEKKALNAFKPIINKFTRFYGENPKVIKKESFSSSPTQVVYSINEYHFIDVSYNIEKTNSIISPLIGYFEITLTSRENAKCGNVESGSVIYGYDKIEAALIKDIEECFSGPLNVDSPEDYKLLRRKEKYDPYKIKFTFAYQDNKWILKNISHYNEILGVRDLDSMRHPLIEPAALPYNKKWVELFQDF